MGSLSHPNTFRQAKQRQQRALLVAEDPEIGAAVADLLHEIGFITWVSADAAAATVLTAEIGFDLMVVDVALSGATDGVGLAVELRRRYPDMGIIILVHPFDTFPDGIEEFITFRKPRPKIGARYDPVRFRFQ